MLKTYNQMLIEEDKYERDSASAVLALEKALQSLVSCSGCNGQFIPKPKNRKTCDVCRYGVDNSCD